MHILFLTDNFPPEVNAPASRTFEHAREWVRNGHRVTVITCVPNFPKGEVYPGYENRIWQREVMDGIEVIRVWSYVSANQGFVRRILDYVSYMCSATLAAPFVGGVDVVIGTSPQFFTASAAYLVSKTKRIPFVFELRDLWPESIKAVGAMQDSWAIGMLERLEMRLYHEAAAIVSVTRSFREVLSGRGVDPDKIHVVTNGVDLSRFRPRPKDPELAERFGLQGHFVAGYIGTHGMAHGLETILHAADVVRRRPDGDLYRFVLLGDGARKKELVKKAAEMRLGNVIFFDSVPKHEVARYWSLLDASVIHLKKSELFKTVIPSKLFECMGMGIPVLHGVAGESAEIVVAEQVGVVFEPENVQALCDGLVALATDRTLYGELTDNCLRAARKYERHALAREVLTVLETILEPRPAVQPSSSERVSDPL